MSAWHREDLAYVHHVGFGDFADSAAPRLLTALRAADVEGGLVVDLGWYGPPLSPIWRVWKRETVACLAFGHVVVCVGVALVARRALGGG